MADGSPGAWVRVNHRTRNKHGRDKRWEVVYEAAPDRRRRTRGGFATKAEADEWAQGFRAKARTGGWIDPVGATKPFVEVAQAWLDVLTSERANTRAGYATMLRSERSQIVRTFGKARLGDVTYGAVRAWLKQMNAEGRSATTVRNNYYVLRSVLTYAVDSGWLVTNPTDAIRRRDLPSPKRSAEREEDRHPLAPAEVERIIAALPEPWDTYARVVAATGLRPGEAAALTLADVDLDAGVVHVRAVIASANGRLVREETTKTASSRRTVELDDLTIAALRGYLVDHERRAREAAGTERPPGATPLFVGLATGSANGRPDVERLDYSKPMSHSVFHKRHWRAACQAAGVPDNVRFYDLRHAHASLLVAGLGQPGWLTLKEIQARLGHASAVMTLDRYSHAPADDRGRRRAALNAASAASLPANVLPFDRHRTG